MKLNKKLTFVLYMIMLFTAPVADNLLAAEPDSASAVLDDSTGHGKTKSSKNKQKSKFGHHKNTNKRNFKSVVNGASAAVEALKFDPFDKRSVWDQDYISKNPELAAILKKFISGQYASSLSGLEFKTNNISDIISTLEKSGFKLAETNKEKLNAKDHKKHCDSNLKKIYVHSDGGAVKVITREHKKTSGLNIRIKKMVLFSSDKGQASWKNVAFVVSKDGVPLPKSLKGGMRMLDDNDKNSDVNSGWKKLISKESEVEILK